MEKEEEAKNKWGKHRTNLWTRRRRQKINGANTELIYGKGGGAWRREKDKWGYIEQIDGQGGGA